MPRPDTFRLTLPDFDALANVLGRFESLKLEGFHFWADDANYNTPLATPRTDAPVRFMVEVGNPHAMLPELFRLTGRIA